MFIQPLNENTHKKVFKINIAECRSKVLQNAALQHSTIQLTCIKLPHDFKTFDLSIFVWPMKTGFTVKAFS